MKGGRKRRKISKHSKSIDGERILFRFQVVSVPGASINADHVDPRGRRASPSVNPNNSNAVGGH